MLIRSTLFNVFVMIWLGTLSVHAATTSQKPQQRKTIGKAVAAAKPAAQSPHRQYLQRVSVRPGGIRVRHAAPAEVFNPNELEVFSTASLVIKADDGTIIHEKNIDAISSIASITKLMMAMVVLDSKLPMDEPITLNEEDIDTIKGTGSRLQLGTTLTRDELLRLALMSSENRAASALGRSYPGGLPAFVKEMNLKALALDMTRSSFVDSNGLSPKNVSTASDLAKMVRAAYEYPLIRQYSTGSGYQVHALNGRALEFHTTNALVESPEWHINLQKTGYIREAGRCLVMHAMIADEDVVIVLLDSFGRYSRTGDANRIKKWIEYHRSVRTVG